MAVGYKIYLPTNTDQPERHKYKMKAVRKKIYNQNSIVSEYADRNQWKN
jgi:hypothetical protein